MTTIECTVSPVDDLPPKDETPLELVHRLHGKHLFRFLLRVTLGDRREAEDLLQETMLRAWRHLQDHAQDAEWLRPWLYTVARRVAIDAARSKKARPSEVILTDLGTISTERDDMDRMLDALTVRRGLAALSEDHRRVLVEVFYNGRTAQETAEQLNIPEGTVKSRLHYGLRALPRRLAAQCGDGTSARQRRRGPRPPRRQRRRRASARGTSTGSTPPSPTSGGPGSTTGLPGRPNWSRPPGLSSCL